MLDRTSKTKKGFTLAKLLLLLAIFALNWAWQAYLPALNIWADSIVRSLVLLGGGALIAYKAGLSPEVREQIKHLIKH
jgi:hypothetical protein